MWDLKLFTKRYAPPILWGNRSLTTDECMKEIALIWKEFSSGRFDPKCEDEPIAPKSYLSAYCVPHNFNVDVGYFGFSTRRNPIFFFESSNYNGYIERDEVDVIKDGIGALIKKYGPCGDVRLGNHAVVS